MPAFRDALSDEQIDSVIDYLRGFCTERLAARRPEHAARADHRKGVSGERSRRRLVLQRQPHVRDRQHCSCSRSRVEPSGQIEAGAAVRVHEGRGHVGCTGLATSSLGYKQMLFHSNEAGSILSVVGEFIAPTGDPSKGTGGETPVFETFAAFDQALPADIFVQFRSGVELPIHADVAPKAWYAHTAIGQSYSTGGGLGRTWSPMVEFIADRDFERGAKTNWDIVPQLQIPLSKRMHILGSVGVRIPMNNTAGRPAQMMYYLLWDFADGSLKEGW